MKRSKKKALVIVGFDVLDAAVDSFLGNTVEPHTKEIKKTYSTNLLYVEPGVFQTIAHLDELKKQMIIKDYFLMKPPGTVIDSDMRSGNRVGAFVVEGDTYDEVRQKEKIAFDRIEIYDNNARPMLKRDIYE